MAVDKQPKIVILFNAFKLVAGNCGAALYDPVILVHVKDCLACFGLVPAEQQLRLKGILQAVGRFIGRYKRSVLDRRLHRLAADPVKVQKKGFCKKSYRKPYKNAEKKIEF